jgi:hypothetical protein
LDESGQPLDGEPRPGRRPSRIIVPVPASRKKASSSQTSLDLETYTDHALINEIRGYLDAWRALRNPADWGGATEVVIDGEGQIRVVLSLNAPLASPSPPKEDDGQVWTVSACKKKRWSLGRELRRD